ncbi:MAG: signal peptidase I [Verrucomicrobia bacterium]|nr:signal peptidase I [Verrucomicrobiota bacterium]
MAAWLSIFSVGSYQAVSRYVVTAVVIQGRSMLPTLRDGEHYILNRLSYRYREPERHEVVVIRDPGHQDYAVKRIVAMPGDTLQLKDGAVFVNGQKQIEPYLAPGTTTACPLSSEIFVVLGKDQYFVLGDNRPLSEDSRTYGAIHRSQILGLIAP